MLQTEDNVGAVLVQVQDDLRQVRTSLAKISVSERSETLDVQALSDALQRTETRMRKHAEDYFKIRSRQLVVLPDIEDLPKNVLPIPKWKPSLERIPESQNTHPHKKEYPEALFGKKHKSPIKMCSMSNPAHPNNKTTFHKKWGISLPDVHMKNQATAKHPRMMRDSVLSHQTATPKGCRLPVIPRQEDMNTGLKSGCHQQLKFEAAPESTSVRTNRDCTPLWTARTPPPSMVSKRLEQRDTAEDNNLQDLPAGASSDITSYPFTIIKGQIDPLATDFCHFKQSFTLCWRSVVSALEALKTLLRDFAVPLAKVSGELLAEFSHGWDGGWGTSRSAMSLLSVLENREEVLGLVSRPGQRFKGEGGVEAAATHIQSCWRRFVARTAYLGYCRRKWAAGVIAISWLMRTQMRCVRKALQARRGRELENSRRRAEHLAANWKHIQSSKRTIIHIPSLGYCRGQRLKLMDLDILQNAQISRVCDIRDENVEVIYICPQHLGDDILRYYISLLKCDGAADGADIGAAQASPCTRRFLILTPEAVDFFPTHNMCLSTLLKYSPRTLKRIRGLIQGKQAYIVGGVAHVDDLAVADELDVPVLGPEPAVAQLYSTKSGGRRVFVGAEVDVPPGQGDIYSLNQLHKTLAELMAANIAVQRWLFKIDTEHGGRGTAYCDVCHLSCYKWALHEYHRYGAEQWNTEWIQESVLLRYLDEVPEWLTHNARPAKTSSYPNWACFLKTFLRQGGVVEACPPSDSVTCLTVDLLLEPGGEVTMLSCGDQLHGSCRLETIGSTVPQTSVQPDTLHSICMRVGKACQQRLIVGHVSVDLTTFLDFGTKEQKVWAVDLDVSYSDQLAMTQMLLMITGGTLNCRAGCLDVPKPITGSSHQHQTAAKPPADRRYAVIGSHLFHSNLSMLYHYVFLKMCKAHGIRYNMKRKLGTAFALYDCSKRCRLGMVAVSQDLQGALVTFARSLSVIHQEISSCKIQGETNFKEVIRYIEDVLQTVARNEKRGESKPAG